MPGRFVRQLRGLLIVVVCALAVTKTNAQPLSKEKIVEAWKRRESSIRSIVFKWTEQKTVLKGQVTDRLRGEVHLSARKEMGIGPDEIVPPRDMTFPVPVTLSIDGEKMRHERDGRVWSGQKKTYVSSPYISTFDGEEARMFHPLGTPYLPRPDGSIRAEAEHGDRQMIHLRPVLMHARPISHGVGSSALLKRMAVVSGRSTIAGRSCMELRLTLGTSVQRLWVDPDRDCIVVRRIRQVGAQTVNKMDIRYRRHQDLWMPEGWDLVTRGTNGKLMDSVGVTIDQVLVNPAIPANTFTVVFPPGTKVLDMKTKKKYTVSGASSDRQPDAQGNEREVIGCSYQKVWTGLAGSIAATIAGGIIWTIWRKRQSER